jgi:hypothetical protein
VATVPVWLRQGVLDQDSVPGGISQLHTEAGGDRWRQVCLRRNGSKQVADVAQVSASMWACYLWQDRFEINRSQSRRIDGTAPDGRSEGVDASERRTVPQKRFCERPGELATHDAPKSHVEVLAEIPRLMNGAYPPTTLEQLD